MGNKLLAAFLFVAGSRQFSVVLICRGVGEPLMLGLVAIPPFFFFQFNRVVLVCFLGFSMCFFAFLG